MCGTLACISGAICVTLCLRIGSIEPRPWPWAVLAALDLPVADVRVLRCRLLAAAPAPDSPRALRSGEWLEWLEVVAEHDETRVGLDRASAFVRGAVAASESFAS